MFRCPDNTPPVLLNELSYEKAMNETSHIQLLAEDPEGHKVSFELSSGTGVSVSHTGLLLWHSQEKRQTIQITMKDECGMTSSYDIVLSNYLVGGRYLTSLFYCTHTEKRN